METETIPAARHDVSVTNSVVTAVAEATGRDPTELDPLNDVVDPDALDALFSSTGLGTHRPPSRVEFRYCGRTVVVTGDGTVDVSD